MSFQNSSPPSTAKEARENAQAAIAQGELPQAVAIADAAIRRGLRDPLLYNLLAYDLEERGRLFEALDYLKKALEMAPNDPQVLHGLGLCLSKLGSQREALVAFEASLLHRPRFAPTLHHMGAAFEAIGEDQAARTCYQRATEADAGFADPLAGLASIAARRGQGEEARRYAERALELDADQSTAAIALAGAELAEGHADHAEARLRALLARPTLYGPDRPTVFAMLGDALNTQGRADAAFAAYAEGKTTAARVHDALLSKTQDYEAVARRVLGGLQTISKWPQAASAPARADAPAAHVFLLGFPRSGTTLAGQILAGHPSVVTLDERSPLDAQSAAYLFPENSVEALTKLNAKQLDELRATYWTAISAMNLDVAGKVLIDKLPLNTLKLPMIARLFPQAKIIFAVRDPRDVVWSCFRQSFQINAAMAQFLTLLQTAKFYDVVMQVGEAARAKLPLETHLLRYEALVEDLKSQMQPICDFLGVEWTEAMLDFAAGAEERRIATPSAAQVRRGLYAEGVGQWRAYAAHLQPVLPILEPWLRRFDYAD